MTAVTAFSLAGPKLNLSMISSHLGDFTACVNQPKVLCVSPIDVHLHHKLTSTLSQRAPLFQGAHNESQWRQ